MGGKLCANMFLIALVAYMVGGVFLGRAYFDLFYHIVAMTVILKVVVEREMWENKVDDRSQVS